MERYATRIEDDVLYLETPGGEVEVGSMADVCEIVGGETYTIEYDERAQAAGWLQTDEDGTITFDVRETIADVDFDERFVTRVADAPLERTTSAGYPERAKTFADLMVDIWDSKGAMEPEDY